MSKVKQVDIDGEVYYIRKVRTGEYFACEFDELSAKGNIHKMLSIGLANEDGSRKFPAIDGDQVTPESSAYIDDIPAGDCLKLMQAVTEFNGFDAIEKK